MSDAESNLLYDTLRAAYRDVNPEISDRGAHLVRKLADGLFSRGARVQIGSKQPMHYLYIHHSLDPLGNVLWTCRRWNQALGYNSRAPIGRHISDFLDPGTMANLQENVWPELIRTGKVEHIPLVLIASTKECLNATAKSEILRDEKGGFLRTFAKIKVELPAALARLAAAASSMVLAVA